MPLTTPDNIVYPDAAADTDLWDHFGDLAASVQAALTGHRKAERFIGAAELTPNRAGGGTAPALDALYTPMWNLADANTSAACAALIIPAGATLMDVDLVWTRRGGAAGNFQVRLLTETAPYGAAPALTVHATTALDATLADRWNKTTLGAALPVTAGQMLAIVPERRGTDAGDTSTGALGVAGLYVRFA